MLLLFLYLAFQLIWICLPFLFCLLWTLIALWVLFWLLGPIPGVLHIQYRVYNRIVVHGWFSDDSMFVWCWTCEFKKQKNWYYFTDSGYEEYLSILCVGSSVDVRNEEMQGKKRHSVLDANCNYLRFSENWKLQFGLFVLEFFIIYFSKHSRMANDMYNTVLLVFSSISAIWYSKHRAQHYLYLSYPTNF